MTYLRGIWHNRWALWHYGRGILTRLRGYDTSGGMTS